MLRGAHTVSQEALTDTGTAHLGCPQVPHFLERSVLPCPAPWPLPRVSVYNPCLLSSPSHFVSLSLASFLCLALSLAPSLLKHASASVLDALLPGSCCDPG